MEDIIVSIDPAFHRVERFMLWHNRYASLLAFSVGHCIFYAIARAGLRPFCAVALVVLLFHILDCIKQKRSHLLVDEENKLCDLTKLILRSYRYVCQTHEKLNTLKTENRVKYSTILMVVCLILAYLGVKINGFYVLYFTMLILFTLPAILYHKLIPKLLKRLTPVLEQLDDSMKYQRRSLIDRKDLLVKIDTSTLNGDDDDDDLRRLRSQGNILDEEEEEEEEEEKQQQQQRTTSQRFNSTDDEDEEKLINTNDQSQTILNFRQRYQNETNSNDSSFIPKQSTAIDSNFDMLSDSSSSVADDETARISELYANVGDQIDGKHRIRIKGDELKIKGRSTKQRPKLNEAQFFQLNQDDEKSSKTLLNSRQNNSSNEPDLSSFDFLNDYNEKA